ncbi:hypothetical protein M427DRAFT_502873 [Gonapodya prolifera JEL478]|uniref:Uncharacterized protein n=1 Tax=Gonapodya prolifera (strain JEL478) TaxID=1344416 RepID=A0A139ATR7_GONPJ|nr:hypothetical protein M427DRAFT_502873 [Gonapodya prolifera JEL478]|eukprot:KXS20109.1 hypothetical protein M427DRAFT_502873 [Gonapodya prolifera JEL478]
MGASPPPTSSRDLVIGFIPSLFSRHLLERAATLTRGKDKRGTCVMQSAMFEKMLLHQEISPQSQVAPVAEAETLPVNSRGNPLSYFEVFEGIDSFQQTELKNLQHADNLSADLKFVIETTVFLEKDVQLNLVKKGVILPKDAEIRNIDPDESLTATLKSLAKDDIVVVEENLQPYRYTLNRPTLIEELVSETFLDSTTIILVGREAEALQFIHSQTIHQHLKYWKIPSFTSDELTEVFMRMAHAQRLLIGEEINRAFLKKHFEGADTGTNCYEARNLLEDVRTAMVTRLDGGRPASKEAFGSDTFVDNVIQHTVMAKDFSRPSNIL